VTTGTGSLFSVVGTGGIVVVVVVDGTVEGNGATVVVVLGLVTTGAG